MAARSAGIPGLGVLLAVTGSYLVFIGIRNVPVVDGLKEILRGGLPAGQPSAPAEVPDYLKPGLGDASKGIGGGGAAGGGGLGSRIAAEASAHLGVPYKWGGSDPTGWDCSGLVTWVLVKVGAGGNLPSKAHTTSAQFLTWSGATTIARSATQAGDLCCWAGHIGIAVDANNMVNAPTFGIPTRKQAIYAGVTIRRVNG